MGFGISVDGETVGEGEIWVLGDESRGQDSESRRRWRRMRLWIWGTVAEDEIPYLSGYRNCAGWWISRGGKGMTAQNCEMMNWGGDKGGE